MNGHESESLSLALVDGHRIRWSYWELASSCIKRQSRVRWGKSYSGNEDVFACLIAGHDLGRDQPPSKDDYAQSRSVQ